jgi:hypothetical protein
MATRTTLVVLSSSIVMWGCAASSALGGAALIKPPVEQQCSRYGLKGCPELVDGVILYVGGDEPTAKHQLRKAASKNVPADLQRFAQAISAVLPAKSGGEIAAILTGDIANDGEISDPSGQVVGIRNSATDGSHPGGFPSGPEPMGERAQLSMAAQTDPMRLTTESAFPLRDADKATCQLAGSDGVCVRLEAGPLVVTDAMTPPACSTELIIGATDANGRFGWLAPTNSPGFHGARFLVRPDQWVVVAARSVTHEPGDERCYVTWAAFKPRI